ncbi:aminotransferase class I/II-fold pyridoxal phosphate-dependent enzyme [Candidatus Sumerlaeota bacterium]|nr:aminotransferase class I/II-fold pyridoxal phosphate-dependent enzyme [Candidatus Sumerlaeota bacterium]
MMPELSEHFKTRKPSAIRLAQIKFMERTDGAQEINTAIGNVTLPMHPAMRDRLFHMDAKESPFKDGVVKYSPTVGYPEANQSFLNIIASSGFDTQGLYSQITDGGSQAMELVVVGTCGNPGTGDKPLLLIDAAYTNYKAMAERTGRATVSVVRRLEENGKFTLPDLEKIEHTIQKYKPNALVVIPYDNPTGHFYDQKTMARLGTLCVKYNMWMISDEAYRELFYIKEKTTSLWGLSEKEIPGIRGRRISIETSSKVWNACGLRIGAIITDNEEFNRRCIAENTANLCPNVIGQYIFGALAHEKREDLQNWYAGLRSYYKDMMTRLTSDLKKLLPGIIVSSPDASIYSVIDVRNIAPEGFDSESFVLYCASEGKVELDGKMTTLLVSPMAGFYNVKKGEKNPGKTQMRIAYVETPENMKKVPGLFAELFEQYLNTTKSK